MKNELDKLFQPLHDEILRIFEEEYANVLKPVLLEELNAGTELNGMFSKVVQYYRKTSIFHFYVEPHSNEITIVFNATKETFKISQNLNKLIYNSDSVREFIRSTLNYMRKIH